VGAPRRTGVHVNLMVGGRERRAVAASSSDVLDVAAPVADQAGADGTAAERATGSGGRRAGQDLVLTARMAEEIGRLFPGCPAGRAEAIAAHTGVRGSGRVGRSAAGRAVAEEAVIRAVVASVRHEDTGYDRLLMSGVSRAEARERVSADIDRVLDAWQRG
jgi:hypothetical protein